MEPKTPLSKSVIGSDQFEDLRLPSQVSNFTIEELDFFEVYRTHTYRLFPHLKKPENHALLLLTTNTMNFVRKRKILGGWARSNDGQSLYNQMIRDIPGVQRPEQLALIVAAWMTYRRLVPDRLDDSDQPIRGSYLADLDAHLNGQPLGNSGVLSQHMTFSLSRSVDCLTNQCLSDLLASALDLETPPLHLWDGLFDQYWSLRIQKHSHEAAMEEVSQLEIPKLRWDTTKSGYSAISVHQTLPRKPSLICLDNQPPHLDDLPSNFTAHFFEDRNGAQDIWIEVSSSEILPGLLDQHSLHHADCQGNKFKSRAWQVNHYLHRCREIEMAGEVFEQVNKLLRSQVQRNLEYFGWSLEKDLDLLKRTLCDILVIHLNRAVQRGDKLNDFEFDIDNSVVTLSIGCADPNSMKLVGLVHDSSFVFDLCSAGKFVPSGWFPSSQIEGSVIKGLLETSLGA